MTLLSSSCIGGWWFMVVGGVVWVGGWQFCASSTHNSSSNFLPWLGLERLVDGPNNQVNDEVGSLTSLSLRKRGMDELLGPSEFGRKVGGLWW